MIQEAIESFAFPMNLEMYKLTRDLPGFALVYCVDFTKNQLYRKYFIFVKRSEISIIILAKLDAKGSEFSLPW